MAKYPSKKNRYTLEVGHLVCVVQPPKRNQSKREPDEVLADCQLGYAAKITEPGPDEAYGKVKSYVLHGKGDPPIMLTRKLPEGAQVLVISKQYETELLAETLAKKRYDHPSMVFRSEKTLKDAILEAADEVEQELARVRAERKPVKPKKSTERKRLAPKSTAEPVKRKKLSTQPKPSTSKRRRAS